MTENNRLAQEIYSECYGHLDDKYFRAEVVPEIEDWLNDGETVTTETAKELVEQWREYVTGVDDATEWNLGPIGY